MDQVLLEEQEMLHLQELAVLLKEALQEELLLRLRRQGRQTLRSGWTQSLCLTVSRLWIEL